MRKARLISDLMKNCLGLDSCGRTFGTTHFRLIISGESGTDCSQSCDSMEISSVNILVRLLSSSGRRMWLSEAKL